MAYELNIPILKLYGGDLSIVDYTKTQRGYDITVHISLEDYEHAKVLRRLTLRIDNDERIFHAKKISDFDITKLSHSDYSDVIIEFIGEKPKRKDISA